MELSGKYRFNTDRQRVWELLNDPEFISRAIPKAKNLVVEGDGKYRAEMSVGIGFIRGKFRGAVEITDKAEPESYKLRAEGKGAVGAVKGDGLVTLTEISENQTEVSIDGSARVSGLIGAAGDRALSGAAQKLMDKFFENLASQINKTS